MEKLGRAADHMKILPALFRRGRRYGRGGEGQARPSSIAWSNYANAIASLSIALGHDASKFDPDGPLPEIPKATLPRAEGSAPSRWPSAKTSPCGSLHNVSAAIPALPWSARQRRLPTRWRNGSRPKAPTALRSCFRICRASRRPFVNQVIPELQRRNLFRREYEGATLRENLGLPRPTNRFFQN